MCAFRFQNLIFIGQKFRISCNLFFFQIHGFFFKSAYRVQRSRFCRSLCFVVRLSVGRASLRFRRSLRTLRHHFTRSLGQLGGAIVSLSTSARLRFACLRGYSRRSSSFPPPRQDRNTAPRVVWRCLPCQLSRRIGSRFFVYFGLFILLYLFSSELPRAVTRSPAIASSCLLATPRAGWQGDHLRHSSARPAPRSCGARRLGE